MKIQNFDFSVDLLQVLLWQYNEATALQGLLTQKQSWYDLNQMQFWMDWYVNVFDLRTANLFGLSVWSIILNVPLFVNLDPPPPGAPIFGFNEVPSINTYLNFNNSCFSSLDTQIFLTVEEQRLVLRLRYYQLVSRGAIPEINTFLHELFNSNAVPYQGNAWVLDGFDMTMTYVFDFFLPRTMRIIIKALDLLPRPAGVGLKYVVLTDTVFGFGPSNQNFNNGNFYPDNVF